MICPCECSPHLIVCSQNSTNPDVVEKNCKLEKRTVTLRYSESYSNSSVVEEFYEILVFQSRPRAVVKTSKSGKVVLDKWKNWKDSQAWISITDYPGGGLPFQTIGDSWIKLLNEINRETDGNWASKRKKRPFSSFMFLECSLKILWELNSSSVS